jgi:signal transduction histidine kinase
VRSSFSINEALRLYSGHSGQQLSAAGLEALSQACAEQLRQAQVRRVLVRLHVRTNLQGLSGRLFVDSGLMPNLPPHWQAVTLTPDDKLSEDHFLISDDAQLPFILSARYQGGGYTAFISSDDALIEAARAVLTQYARLNETALSYTPQALIRAGQLLARFSRQYGADIVNSWASQALRKRGLEQLQALQQASGAYWLRWRGLSSGSPARPGGQLMQIATPDPAEHLEALGDAADHELLTRLHICSGILSESPVVEVRSANLDLALHLLSEQGIQADAELDWPELEMVNAPPAPASQPPAPTAAPRPDSGAPALSIPGASLELLRYVNREISLLRDCIMDLGGVNGLAEKPRQRFSEFVQRSGDLLLLIDEVLYIERMAAQIQEERLTIEPHRMLNALLLTYAGEADRLGVTLNCDAPDELPSVLGSPEAVNRALVIMLEHAVDRAKPRGSVTIGARAGDHGVDFFIRDSSPALTEREIAELFTPGFLKKDRSTNSLGFSALKLIAEAHGGALILNRQADMNEVTLRLPYTSS